MFEVAEIPVKGEKICDQLLGHVWDEVWNCAFSTTGNYAINLKIRAKGANSKSFAPLSTVTHDISVSSRFLQTVNPLLLAVVPVLITAIVTVLTTGIHSDLKVRSNYT